MGAMGTYESCYIAASTHSHGAGVSGNALDAHIAAIGCHITAAFWLITWSHGLLGCFAWVHYEPPLLSPRVMYMQLPFSITCVMDP